jgi:phage antirepressor YoqD-like protein
MSGLTTLTTAKTMLSTEIVKIINEMREESAAELAHADFMKKIVKVLGAIDAGKFSAIYFDAYKREKPCYALPKREANLMVMSENYKVQAAVYDRMTELEQKPAFDYATVLSDAGMMRGLLLTYTEKVIALESTVKILEPKAIALDRISSSEGSQCITDSAKALKMQPKKLFSFLQEVHWIYKRAGGKNWLGYQDKIQQGLVEHKITTVTRSDGSEKVVEQVLLLPKGITRLSEMLISGVN